MALNTTQLERYYNAPIGQVYEAMKRCLESDQSRFTLKNADDLSCSCTFSSGISLTTWGENLTASAVPSGDGTLVRLTVAGKLGSTAAGFQNSHNIALADEFFSGVSGVLSAGSAEPPQVTQEQPAPTVDTPPQDPAETQTVEEPTPKPVPDEEGIPEAKAEADSTAPTSQEAFKSKVKEVWDKDHLQIVIAAIAIAIIVLCSIIVAVVSGNIQGQKRLEVIQKVSTACNKDNKIKVLSTGEYAVRPALRFVWKDGNENTLSACVASNTGMPDSIYDKLVDTHSAKDNSSAEWNDWKASWTVDDNTEAATITVQYVGNNFDNFSIKHTIDDWENKGSKNDTETSDESTAEEDSAPKTFDIDLSCSITSGDDDTSVGNREHITGVTTQNFRDTVWKTGKPVKCFTTGEDLSNSSYSMSDIEKKALNTAYGDNNDGVDDLDILYSICASTSDFTLSMQTMSEAQAKEWLGALVLCPDHPRAEEIRQKAGIDTARQTEIQTKRQQGLIKDAGTYKVPDEMSTGTWKTMSDKVENCYWEMQDVNGQTIDNNFVSAGIAQTITIPDGVAGFSSEGCGAWEKQ